ncbi:UNVERIFIED_CONTAM: putative E3 ubiquitin-protein ligase HIP1 [Sesamum latifolium]|uniref:RING-type E3 ubiquitin transferase n=1 Tax=Sesamum latifolium TaxID=2727402 RepID=A0AAW2UIS9_9LAMI
MLPHQLYSAARSGGAQNVAGGFQGLLPHQIINIPSNNPAGTSRGHGHVQVQERNWFQEDETLILDIGTAPGRENAERDGGLSERLILKYLKTRDCRRGEVSNDGEAKMCVVCQDDLCQENTRIGVLDCGHEYHASCIRQWLQQKNTCPLCKTIALRV